MFNLHLSILIGQPDSVKQGSNPPPYSYPETSIPGTVEAVGGEKSGTFKTYATE